MSDGETQQTKLVYLSATLSEKDTTGSRLRMFAVATEFGAAWKKTARDSEREYLSVKLDNPSFPAPIYASLVMVKGDEGFSLIWPRSGDCP